MAITVSTFSILGTSCPWKLGGSANNPGTASVLASFGAGFCDGSAAGGGTGSQNSGFLYGQQHVTPSGETGPTTLAVSPGQTIFLQYLSGTVATQAGGAGNSPPTGSATTTLTPPPGGVTDAQGYVLPTNVIAGINGFKSSGINFNGTVNTSGTAVTLTAGGPFVAGMAGMPIWINNTLFTVSTVNVTAGTLVLTGSAGTLTGVNCFMYGATTSIGGIVGAFTDSSGNIITNSTFDWKSWGGTSSANSFIALTAPAGAAFLTMGINDSILRDNTGSFSMKAFIMDTDYVNETGTGGFWGGPPAFPRYPASAFTDAFGGDFTSLGGTNLKQCVWMATYPMWQYFIAGYKLITGYVGQLWPHGAQQNGGTPHGLGGQGFPF